MQECTSRVEVLRNATGCNILIAESSCDILVEESGSDIPVATPGFGMWSRNLVATFQCDILVAGCEIWLWNLIAEYRVQFFHCGCRMRSEHSWCLTLMSNKRLQYAVTCFRLTV